MPGILSLKENIVAAPVIVSSKYVFRDTLAVEIKSLSENQKVYFTTDGSEPAKNSQFSVHSSQFRIDSTTTIKSFAENENGRRSKTVTAHFFKMPHPVWKISLEAKYSPQYTAGGDEGLIDGLRGSEDWRKGYWQGYQSQDFECVIDLGTVQKISKLGAGFLQDVGAWILFPKKVEFEISTDGEKYSKAATIENKIPDNDLKVQTKDFVQTISKQKVRYVKIKAVNYGKLPKWHAGAGGDTWIFVDEIMIE